MIEPLSYATAFLLGLLGASHCLVMCGGIAAASSMSTSGKPVLTYQLLFNSGRISSYALSGFLVSAAGLWLSQDHLIAQTILRSIAGALLILMGLYVARWWMALTRLEQAGQFLWKFIQPVTRRLLPVTSAPKALSLGFLWGWLPCGLIYSTLAWVGAYGEPLEGAIAMACFGLGTLPGILSAGLLARQLSKLIQNQYFRSASGVLLIIYGIWTLWGIYNP